VVFFRDPHRVVPSDPWSNRVPRRRPCTEATTFPTPEGPRKRISIFLSVFDVHVNRAPIAGELREIRYHKGQYLNAMNPKSADSKTSGTS